ncbi:ankyrin repeat-containing domain protein [Aspergillus heterothallicus]
MPYAARIPGETWDRHKEEIIRVYLASSLEQMKDYMGAKYGFQPSKNQYTTKLDLWGIKKNHPSRDWVAVDRVKRKRRDEGKESNVAVRKRIYTGPEADREIARHVPLREQWYGLDYALPEYITVFTPMTQTTGVSREALLRNLPWNQYARDIATLAILEDNFIEQPPGCGLLGALPDLTIPSRLWFGPRAELDPYIPPQEINSMLSPATTPEISRNRSLISSLKVFCQRLIFVVTNNLLDPLTGHNMCKLIRERYGIDALLLFCRLTHPSTKVFIRMALTSAVMSRDTELATRVLEYGTGLEHDRQSQYWSALLTTAVHDGYDSMVRMLCNAGVPSRVNYWLACGRQGWERRLPILRTLLAFRADPETFVASKGTGYPLVNAAYDGCLEAVELLLGAGARVNLFVPQYYGTALQAACWGGHLAVARSLIQHGAAVDLTPPLLPRPLSFYFDEYFMTLHTPLQIAAKVNSLPLVDLLLKNGADPMACPAAKDPAEVEALSYYGDTSHWLKQDSPLTLYEKQNLIHTPLQYAAINQNPSTSRSLLDAGAYADSRVATHIGDTPLQTSASLGNLEMVRLFLAHGADVNAPPMSRNGRTALQGAAESGNLEVLFMILNAGALVNASAGEDLGLTALQAACFRGHSLASGFLLAHGADVNAPPSPIQGLTSIQAAALSGDVKLINSLITLGADVDAPAAAMGTTALVVSVRHKSLPILQLLLEHGADVNRPADCEFRTPFQEAVTALQEAASRDWLEGVEFLLEHGAKVHSQAVYHDYHEKAYEDTFNPLGWAITNDNEEMTELLLRNGADVCAIAFCNGLESCGPLILALRRKWTTENLGLIFDKAPDLQKHPGWETALQTVYEYNDVPDIEARDFIMQKALSMPPDVRRTVIQTAWDNLPDWNGYGGPEELLEFVKFLIKSGASINSRNDDGSTLLQRLSSTRNSQACLFLLENGASVNPEVTDHIGTPLQEALKEEQVELANILLEHGADINAFPAKIRGVTALQAASIGGMFKMALRLLESGADVAAAAAPHEGRTAIDGAAERGRRDMIQLLLNAYQAKDMDVSPVCRQAAEYAEREGHIDLARWLREYSQA